MDTRSTVPTARALIDWWYPRAGGPALRLREHTRHYLGDPENPPDDVASAYLDVMVEQPPGGPAIVDTFVVDAEVAAALLPHLLDVLAREGCPTWNEPMWRALGTLARPLLLEQADALRGPLDGTEEPF